MGVSDEPSPLSTPFHKYDHVCCVDFRFWRGATREHPPKWGCDRGATKPEPKSDATLRAAVLFGPDVVAHSLQTPEGYARRSRLVWAKNPSPQTWSYLWNGVLSQNPLVGQWPVSKQDKFFTTPAKPAAAQVPQT